MKHNLVPTNFHSHSWHSSSGRSDNQSSTGEKQRKMQCFPTFSLPWDCGNFSRHYCEPRGEDHSSDIWFSFPSRWGDAVGLQIGRWSHGCTCLLQFVEGIGALVQEGGNLDLTVHWQCTSSSFQVFQPLWSPKGARGKPYGYCCPWSRLFRTGRRYLPRF